MKPELIVLILALVLVVAVANTPSLSSEVRLILFLLALVAIILAGLHDQGMMRPRPPTRSSWSRQAVSGLSSAPWPVTRSMRAGMTPATAAATMPRMSLPPDLPPPSPPEKPKMSAEERRQRQKERQQRQEDRRPFIRLRMAIHHELDGRGITTPAAIGEALGIPAAEAAKLLTRRQWCEDDMALLQAAAARLGVQVPGP
jgi:hypothetical protein